ncbi:MerR family DNA-binding protein [Streptomyces sp. NPDC054838]
MGRHPATVRPDRNAQRAGFTLTEIRRLLGTEADRGTTKQRRTLAELKIPELDRFGLETQALRNAVADCLVCACMNFDSCQERPLEVRRSAMPRLTTPGHRDSGQLPRVLDGSRCRPADPGRAEGRPNGGAAELLPVP